MRKSADTGSSSKQRNHWPYVYTFLCSILLHFYLFDATFYGPSSQYRSKRLCKHVSILNMCTATVPIIMTHAFIIVIDILNAMFCPFFCPESLFCKQQPSLRQFLLLFLLSRESACFEKYCCLILHHACEMLTLGRHNFPSLNLCSRW